MDPEVREKLRRDGRIHACVVLDDADPRPDTSTGRIERRRTLQDLVVSRLEGAACRTLHRFRFSPVLVLELESEEALDRIVSMPEVKTVQPDPMGSGALDQSRALIHADEAFALGLTGAGRVVAVLDSGLDTDHPDLRDAIVHQYHFLSGDNGPGAEDDHGHGTNVTGIIAGRGVEAPRGVAPGALVVAIKVLDSKNRGYLSDWAAGVEHVVALHETADGIRVDAINMSLASDAQFDGVCDDFEDSFSAACRAAQELGIVLLAASGNSSSTLNLASPACYSSVYAVGSVLDTLPNRISSFTNRNQLLDLLAPGQPITATGIGGGTSVLQGTSQACPHAVAAALLLRQIDPALDPSRLLDVLRWTGVPVSDAGTGLTFPRIEVLAACELVSAGKDCNSNGVLDSLDIHVDGTSPDCNENEVPDECDIASGTSQDLDADGVPDECVGYARFHRGDPNDDGVADVSDGIFVFAFLFLGGPEPDCLESSDDNNDGAVDISDGIGILNFLFSGGPPPASPGPPTMPCASDPDLPGSEKDLGCRRYTGC